MYGNFLVEGHKSVLELLHSSFKTIELFATSEWLSQNENVIGKTKFTEVTDTELQKIATQENPHGVIALAEIPNTETAQKLDDGIYIALDSLSDPGNAGTVIRIADWFGFSGVIFSQNSVEIFNPKTVSAAKGSLFNIKVFATDLAQCFESNKNFEVYGTFMIGENIYNTPFPEKGILLIGNEANGISEALLPHITKAITIPKFGNAESLNAGVAAGIIASEWRKGEHHKIGFELPK